MAERRYKLKQDTRYGCVRTARVELAGFDISILYNESLKHAGVSIERRQSPFAPTIMRMPDSSFSLCYEHAVIFDANREEFEREYRRAIDFCNGAKAEIDGIVAKLDAGEDL